MAGAPYRGFAAIYDRVMQSVDYEMWTDYVLALCRLYGLEPRRILDLACGTGNTTLPFVRRGYAALGIDRSPAMLQRARAKALREGRAIEFLAGDMRRFELAAPVDLAICLYDSINYLLSLDELVQACACVRRAVRPGGLFIFDANTPHRLAQAHGETLIFDEEDLCLVWRNTYAAPERIWRADLTGFVRRGELFERFQELHEEHAYTIAELREAPTRAGLEALGVFVAFGFQAAGEDTARAYVVARRPASAGDQGGVN